MNGRKGILHLALLPIYPALLYLFLSFHRFIQHFHNILPHV